jgi:hypothetical protein
MSTKRIPIPGSVGFLGEILDLILVPLMYLVSGTIFESPQRTHGWNSTRLKLMYVSWLDQSLGVHCLGDRSASNRWLLGVIPLFHIPILGGWRNYIALKPESYTGDWHVVWAGSDVFGMSLLKIRGTIRMLRGPHDTDFFGVNVHGEQIKLVVAGYGTIGKRGAFRHCPLL